MAAAAAPTAVLVVDIGTTSLRTVLFDGEGAVRHVAQRHNPPGYFEGGGAEQDAVCWRDALVATLCEGRAAAERAALRPQAIAVTAQRSSVLPVAADGTPLHPALMWQDTRAGTLAGEIAARHEDAVYRRCGLRVSPVFSAVKMAWLRRERPAVWAATHKLLGVQDWALWLLTGRFVTDHSFGSRTNLMDLARRDWDEDLLALFGVPRSMLCDLVAPGSVVGGLGAAVAAATGLPRGLPVISAGGDQQCAALGLGLFGPGLAVTNVGTGCYLIGHAEQPVFDVQRRVACNVAALPGACIVEASVLTAGAAHDWFAQLAAPGMAPQAAFELLEAEAAQAPPGAHGVVVLPQFRGAGTPHWDPAARGALLNLGLATTRGDIARALLEGIAAELRTGLDLVEQLTAPIAAVHAAGGMTRSALFDQILADMLERPLSGFGEAEATAQGAWIVAAAALGLFDSLAAAHARLAQLQTPHRFAPDAARAEAGRALRRRALTMYQALAATRAPHAG